MTNRARMTEAPKLFCGEAASGSVMQNTTMTGNRNSVCFPVSAYYSKLPTVAYPHQALSFKSIMQPIKLPYSLLLKLWAIFAFCLIGLVSPLQAQEPPTEPPYDKDMTRLSEITGALAFLRPLCGGLDATEWPKRMQTLLDAEALTPQRRTQFIGAYNTGYRNYALTYRVCTPAAQEAIRRYLDEGEKLTRKLANRFGG